MNVITVEGGCPKDAYERMLAARGRGLEFPIGYDLEPVADWLNANVHGDVIQDLRNIPFGYQVTVFVMNDAEWANFILRWGDQGTMR